MKKLLLLTIAILLFAGLLISSSKCEINVKDPLHIYSSKIDKQVENISNKEDLEEKRKPLFGQSAEGGEMLSYFEGDLLQKIKLSYLGETGRSEFNYFFDNEKLIYAIVREVAYDRPIYEAGVKEFGSTENKFYFKSNRLIRWDAQEEAPKSWCNSDYPDWEKRILENLSEIRSIDE